MPPDLADGAARPGELPHLLGPALRGAQHEPGGGIRFADAPQMPAGIVEPGGGALARPADPAGRALPRGTEAQQRGAGLPLQALGEQVCGPGEKSRCLHRSLRSKGGGEQSGHAHARDRNPSIWVQGEPGSGCAYARPADRDGPL